MTIKILFSLFFIFVCLMKLPAADTASEGIQKIQILIDQQKWSIAISRLEKLAKSKNISKEEQGIVFCMLARCYRETQKYDKARKILDILAESSHLDSFYIEYGELLLAMQEPEKALTVGMNCTASGNEDAVINGYWIKARSNRDLKRYRDSIRDCERVLEQVNKKLQTASQNKTKKELELEKFTNDVEVFIKELQDVLERCELGPDYQNYRLGREAQFTGRYNDAIVFYRKIYTKGILRDAARCYIGECFFMQEKYKEALLQYEDILNHDKNSLYWGEVIYYKSFVSYLQNNEKADWKKSVTLLDDAQKWADDFSKRVSVNLNEAGINMAISKQVIEPMRNVSFLKNDDCGSLIRNSFSSGSVINPTTAPWYIPMLKIRLSLLKGFLLGEIGEIAEAASEYKKISDIPEKKSLLSDASILPALLSALIEGGYFLPGECYDGVSPAYRKNINMVFFLFITEEKETGEWLLNQLNKDELRAKVKDAAVRDLAKAFFSFMNGASKDGMKYLRNILKNKKLSQPFSDWCKYLYVCQEASKSQLSLFVSNSLFELYKEGKGDIPSMALAALVQHNFNHGNLTEAEKYAELLSRKGKKHWKETGKTMYEGLGILKKNLSQSTTVDIKILSDNTVETKYGKIINLPQTIVPGGKNHLVYDTGDFDISDILFCRMTYISRNNCLLIRELKTSLSILEPQPPPSKGNKIAFLRIPGLFTKRVWYDFDKEPSINKKNIQ